MPLLVFKITISEEAKLSETPKEISNDNIKNILEKFGRNLNEEVNFEKVNYSVNGNQSYSVGTNIDDNAVYVDKVVVRVELDYEVEKVERDKTASTLKAVNSEKNRVRLELKEQHSRENNRLFESIDVDYYQSYYICTYSPHIEYEYYKNDFLLHKDEILSKLNSNPNIVSISVEEYKDRI